jgi:hypothetical protein
MKPNASNPSISKFAALDDLKKTLLHLAFSGQL